LVFADFVFVGIILNQSNQIFGGTLFSHVTVIENKEILHGHRKVKFGGHNI